MTATETAMWIAGGGIALMLLGLLFIAIGADVYDWWLTRHQKRPGFIGNRWRR